MPGRGQPEPAGSINSAAAGDALTLTSLQAKLVDAAAECIREEGIHAVRARAVATRAGYSVGMIYHGFGDLYDLLFTLNQRTCHQLDQALQKVEGADPRQCLEQMAIAYLRFAHDNKQLWRAMFELRVGPEKTIPETYKANVMATFARIPAALGRLFPALPPAEIDTLSRVMFSSVHGIVTMGLDETFVAVPLADLEAQLCRFVEIFVAGLEPNKAQRSVPAQ
jgi:AcrR family transcriptional regulator